MKINTLRKNKNDIIDMKMCLRTLEKLIKEDKIEFSFYNNTLLDLDLLQIYYSKDNNKIVMKFRDVMEEHLQELRGIKKKIKSINIIFKKCIDNFGKLC